MDKTTKTGVAVIVWAVLLIIIVVIMTDGPLVSQAQQLPPVPYGAVLFWPAENGPIPKGWSEYLPARGRFLMGNNGQTLRGLIGGAEVIDISHVHGTEELVTSIGAHGHNLQVGNDLGQGASYAVATGTDNHSHSLSGQTGLALSSTQSIMPPFISGIWIQRSPYK